MKSSLSLIREANELLDSIGESGKFDPAHVPALEAMREDMADAGFNAPFAALLKMTRSELEEMEEGEFDDLRKQMRHIKYVANLKRFTLRRVRVALASHRIAASALGRGREELVPFLPLDGNHVRILAKAGEVAIEAYEEMMRELAGAGQEFRAVVEVEFERDGEKVSEQLKLAAGERVEEKVRKTYGKEAVLKGMRVVRAVSSIIRRKSSRLALVCAEVACAAAKAKKALAEDEGKNEKVRGYNLLLAEEGIAHDVRLDLVEGHEKVKEKLVAKGLMRREKTGLVLDEGLGAEIRRRRALMHALVRESAVKSMLGDMLRFYVLNGKAEREANSIYPALAAEPTPEQLEVFGLLGELIGVKGLGLVVGKKLAAEKMGMGMRSTPFGAAVFSLESGRNAKWCAEFFGVPEKGIEEAVEKVKAAGKETGRGAEFLKKMKGK